MERHLLETLTTVGAEIAAQFGSSCEGVIHDLKLHPDHSIVAIFNGHVSGRKVGDVELVTSEDYGAHILYFDGNGLTAWEASAKSALTQQAMDDAYDALKEKFTVTLDEKVMNSLPA